MIDELRRYGIAQLGRLLTAEQCAEVRTHLATCHAWHSHIYGSQSRSYVFGDHAYCYNPAAVLTAPHLLELFLRHAPSAAEYLMTEVPRLYSVNAFCMRRREDRPNLSEFHRDCDDHRFVGLFVYLTDVLEAADGAHEFVLGSHLGGPHLADSVVSVLGPAGTAFMADTSGLHRGVPPRADRMMAWARWCVSERPATYTADVLPVGRSVLGGRYPQDEAIRRSIELVVR